MPCYKPLRGWPVSINLETGKRRIKVTSYDTKLQQAYDGSWLTIDDSFDIPCGKCIGCRLRKSREWAQRCMLELLYHESSYFVTLTYDDDHLPHNEYIDENGEVLTSEIPSLSLRDCQLFLKRLRKNTGQDLRVFYCGEYGSESFRPHYHFIIFGLELNDLKIYKQNFRGDLLYNSPTVEKSWRDANGNLIGHVVIAEVNWETCAYVARYTVKKEMASLTTEFFNDLHIVKPFVHMSNKPGIAKRYFDDHFQDIYLYDKIFMSTQSGGKVLRPAPYFDRKFDELYPSDMERIKEKRAQFADYTKKFKENETGLSYDEILSIEEEILLKSLGKVLERSEI